MGSQSISKAASVKYVVGSNVELEDVRAAKEPERVGFPRDLT